MDHRTRTVNEQAMHIEEARSLRIFYYSTFQPLKLRSRSINTKRLYATTLNNFERYLERPAMLDDLTDDTVGRFLAWFMAQAGGRSPYSANKEHANLLAIWRFACRRNGHDGLPLVRAWPTVERYVEPQNAPQAWLDHELSALFAVLSSLPGNVGEIHARDWWMTLHLVMWDTGERIGALMRLRWQHMDLQNSWIIVPAAFRKGGRTGRTYRLHQETAAALKKIRRLSDDPVWPWPYSPTYLWYRYSRILRLAGLPCDAKCKFHRMRRSVASHAEAAGLNATNLLGHFARKVTLRYLDPRIAREPAAADVLFRPGASP